MFRSRCLVLVSRMEKTLLVTHFLLLGSLIRLKESILNSSRIRGTCQTHLNLRFPLTNHHSSQLCPYILKLLHIEASNNLHLPIMHPFQVHISLPNSNNLQRAMNMGNLHILVGGVNTTMPLLSKLDQCRALLTLLHLHIHLPTRVATTDSEFYLLSVSMTSY